MRKELSRPYRVNSTRVYVEESTLPDGMIDVLNITARLTVTSYQYEKLRDILNRYLNDYAYKAGSISEERRAIDEVRKKVTSSFDDILKIAMDAGGNNVFAWHHKLKKFLSYPLSDEEQKLVDEAEKEIDTAPSPSR